MDAGAAPACAGADEVSRPWLGGAGRRHAGGSGTGVAAATGHLLITSPHTGIISPRM